MYSTWRGRLAVAGAVATLVASGPVAAHTWGGLGDQVRMVLTAKITKADTDFVIGGGKVTGLYPGATRNLSLSVANPYNFPIRVTAVSGRAESTSDRKCKPVAKNLVVDQYRGTPDLPVTVAAHGLRKIGKLPVRMPGTAVDACQRVKFDIELHGTATKVNR